MSFLLDARALGGAPAQLLEGVAALGLVLGLGVFVRAALPPGRRSWVYAAFVAAVFVVPLGLARAGLGAPPVEVGIVTTLFRQAVLGQTLALAAAITCAGLLAASQGIGPVRPRAALTLAALLGGLGVGGRALFAWRETHQFVEGVRSALPLPVLVPGEARALVVGELTTVSLAATGVGGDMGGTPGAALPADTRAAWKLDAVAVRAVKPGPQAVPLTLYRGPFVLQTEVGVVGIEAGEGVPLAAPPP